MLCGVLCGSTATAQDVGRLRELQSGASGVGGSTGISDPAVRTLQGLESGGSRFERGRPSGPPRSRAMRDAEGELEPADGALGARDGTDPREALGDFVGPRLPGSELADGRGREPAEVEPFATRPAERLDERAIVEAAAARQEELETLSAFERQLLPYADSLVGRPVRQFGYEIFRSVLPETGGRPVGSDYLLGREDEIVVSLWGTSIDDDYTVSIGSDGQVRLPEIGIVTLTGSTLEEARETLRRAYDEKYTNYELRVRLGRIRDIGVHVIGRVERPGRVRVSSLGTLFDALARAGGVAKDGSLRRVRVRRVGAEDRVVDLYDYLLEGDVTVDVQLRAGDAVVVPTVGPRVGVVGRVLRPAIYELAGDEAPLSEALSMSGGWARLADRTRVEIESAGIGGLTVREARLDDASGGADSPVRDGDVVVVRSASPKTENVVYVVGNVSTPGRYPYREGLRVSDLLTDDALIDAGFWLRRRPPTSGEEVSDLPEPFLGFALVRRIDAATGQERRIAFRLGGVLLDEDPDEDIALAPQDTVVIYSRADFEVPRIVYVSGPVHKPGEHRFTPGMRVRDLVLMAGGVLPEAHLASAVLTRVHSEQEGARYEHRAIDLAAALAGDPSSDLALQPDDALAIKLVPEYRSLIRVTVEGEVRHPGTYTVIPGETLSDLLERAGGMTDDAYLPAASYFSESVRELQQRAIEDSLRRLEIESKLASQQFAAEAAATGENVDALLEQERIDRVIATIRENPALGRRVIHMRSIEELRASDDDFELRDEDRLVVPRRPQEVHVVGAVFNQTALLWRDGRRASEYLRQCGGALDSSNMDLAYIIRADGTADSAKFARRDYRWDSEKARYSRGDLLDQRLYPGDTLVVPYDVEPKLSKLGLTKTVTEILFQAALSTGVIVALL